MSETPSEVPSAQVAPAASPSAEPDPAEAPDAAATPEAVGATEASPSARASGDPATAEPPLPTKAQAFAASRARLGGGLARLTPTQALGDGAAVVAWVQLQGECACEAEVVLVRLVRGDTGDWSAADTTTVAVSRTPWLGDDTPPLAVTLVVEDFDDDGETEVLVRARQEIMCPGGGPNTVTALHIYNLAPTFSVALQTELHHSMEAQPLSRTAATVEHVDINDDGHRDVRIDYVTTTEDAVVTARNEWRFDADSDSWRPHVLGTEAFDCEW